MAWGRVVAVGVVSLGKSGGGASVVTLVRGVGSRVGSMGNRGTGILSIGGGGTAGLRRLVLGSRSEAGGGGEPRVRRLWERC